ncbi:MAG: hypothetical protein IJW16_05045 [Clostridia bacterium]|nr:hypothetical protein [Clostridia bacterium]
MNNRYVITDYGVKENCQALQTAELQAVFDLCKTEGGTVVIPKGRFYVGALRMWSDTTLYLESGAELYGSDDCNDYEVFPIPEGMEMRSDMEMITQYYGTPWETYRRAIITAYGEKNISIIGERDSVIDGANCYDPDGEEHYRGPHAIFFSCCENVHLEGYTAQNSGNFLHEANNCKNLVMRHVTCLAGSDGIHLHCTENALIEECVFKTGDDCIAGINIKNMTVRKCILNTSCNLFRMGGVGILVEDCYAHGPGYYPHRKTVVKGKNDELPREEGRHNMLSAVSYFASANYPFVPSDITFKNCLFDNLTAMCHYKADVGPLQSGTHWGNLTLENVRFSELLKSCTPIGSAKEPMTIRMKNVSVSFRENSEDSELFKLEDGSNVTLIKE